MSQGFFPDLTKFDNLVLASGIFLFYAGMEMMGIHVMDVKEPASKNYPKAIFIGAGITVVIFVLGTFALGLIIPAKDINLTQSLLVRVRRVSQIPAYQLGIPGNSYRLDVRCACRSAYLGCGSVKRYFHRG